MAKLSELRRLSGVGLEKLAKDTGIAFPTLNRYEKGNLCPQLEDVFKLENYFQTKMEWDESIPAIEKRKIIQDLITLLETYPLEIVLNFAPRGLREGIKVQDTGCLIHHYAKLTE